MLIRSQSEQDTYKAGARLGASLHCGDVVALTGDLGAGKTVFVKGLASALHVGIAPRSPTFSILNEHQGDMPLYHFDMFRIEGYGDLYSTGFFDIVGGEGVTAIEWSEKIAAHLPQGVIRVDIAKTGEQTRDITIEGGGLT